MTKTQMGIIKNNIHGYGGKQTWPQFFFEEAE
jgi:hypothetical protein